MQLNYPLVHTDKNKCVFVSFYINNKRYRLYSGKRIGYDINPNYFPEDKRISIGHLLAAKVYNYLTQGGKLEAYRSSILVCGKLTDKECLKRALELKCKGDYSDKYKQLLKGIYKGITEIMKGESLSSNNVKTYLDKYSSGVSYNTVRRHLNVLINEAIKQGMKHNPMQDIKSRKSKAKLHKPFTNVVQILEEIKVYNHNLYLCCLITYGCLLRPHREVRELTWGDFSADLNFINLSGERNKSGKNRVVPVTDYINKLLVKGYSDHNIFTGTTQAPNRDYFKTLWSRFKAQSSSLQQGQTLYSFRHTGAIEIYQRTGSLTKLQQAMGHSSLNVSLTYLRGLEITELKQEDMPTIKHLQEKKKGKKKNA